MYKIGLKLWSTNTDYYFYEAQKLYKEGVCNYVELYIVPNTVETLEKWKTLGVPINLHCPHFFHGFNLAQKEKFEYNREIYTQVKYFADSLKSEYIVFHGGIDGDIRETARQLKSFHEARAILENKPFQAIANKMGGILCRGATLNEVQYVLNEVNCGFCLDIGHAICSANSQKIDKWKFIDELNRLKPNLYHLTDLKDVNSVYDSHVHIGEGTLNIKRALSYVTDQSLLTVETEKSYVENLRDFREDVKKLINVE